jgi:hypothetical protein
MRLLPLALCLLGLAATATRAQDAPMIRTEVLTLALEDPVAGLFFHNGKEIALFQANLTGLGQPLAYHGPSRFLLRASEAEFAAKPPLPAPVATVDLPPGADRVLLLCLKSGKEPLKLKAYDISTGKSGAGDYRFFNFSNQGISIILGDRRFALQPGRDSNVTDPSWKKETLDLPMQMAVVKEGKPKLVYSAVWGHRSGRRNFIFLFDGKQVAKPVGVYRFFDIPSAAAPNGAPAAP